MHWQKHVRGLFMGWGIVAAAVAGTGCPIAPAPPEPVEFEFTGTIASIEEIGDDSTEPAAVRKAGESLSVGDTVAITALVVFNQQPGNPLLSPLVLQIQALNAAYPDLEIEIAHAEYVSSSLASYVHSQGFGPQTHLIGYLIMQTGESEGDGVINVATSQMSIDIRNDDISPRNWTEQTPVDIVVDVPAPDDSEAPRLLIRLENAVITSMLPQ